MHHHHHHHQFSHRYLFISLYISPSDIAARIVSRFSTRSVVSFLHILSSAFLEDIIHQIHHSLPVLGFHNLDWLYLWSFLGFFSQLNSSISHSFLIYSLIEFCPFSSQLATICLILEIRACLVRFRIFVLLLT